MSKRDFLAMSPDYSSYSVAAIHANIGAHKLAWHIDQLEHTSFWLNEEPLAFEIQEKASEHNCFCCQNDDLELKSWIVSNSGTEGSLLAGKPKADHFLVLQSDNADGLIKNWTEYLHASKAISMYRLLTEKEINQLHWILYLP
jgi:hypothetical protein